MKKYFTIFILFLFFVNISGAQTTTKAQDEIAIKKTVMDYADGFYSSDAERMERAISPDINKAIPVKSVQTGRYSLNYSAYAELIELTRAKAGAKDADKRNIEIWILSLDGIFANAKINSADFNDYLQLVKVDSTWKIVNVLWNNGMNSPNRIKDFKPEDEREAILTAANNYVDGAFGGNAKCLEMSIVPEFNRIFFSRIPPANRLFLRRQRFETIIENSLTKVGMIDEVQRDCQVKILDIMDGMAVVEINSPAVYEYLQMFKSNDGWKVFNCMARRNPNSSFASQLPVMVDEPMPDFTLPVFKGSEFTLSKHQGKNIMLVFPRGWLGGIWCPICHYQYLELAALEKKYNLRKKYNMEIYFVLPYGADRVADWFDKFSGSIQIIERWKNPQGQNLNIVQKELKEFALKNYSMKFDENIKDVPITFPVLVDADKKVSKRFQIYTTFWDNVSSEQNISTIYIVDEKGNTQFKYNSQSTQDRPNFEYIIRFIKKML